MLYNEDEDEANEAWVTEHLMLGDGTKAAGKKKSNDPNIEAILNRTKKKPRDSDAVLSCPACFTILCYDCQQHENYSNQFRAMFVLQCTVVKEETLTFLPGRQQKGAGKKVFYPTAIFLLLLFALLHV